MDHDHDQRWRSSSSATASAGRSAAPGRTTVTSRTGRTVQRAADPASASSSAAVPPPVPLGAIDTWWSLATGTATPEQYASAGTLLGPVGEQPDTPAQRYRSGAIAGQDPFGTHLNVQLREAAAGDGPSDERTHQLAGEGVAGSGEALPFLDEIQRSFGPAHDLSGVRAYIGGQAARAAGGMHAHAYATGDQIAFAASPDLALAAHEATHVVQQRGGVQLKGGLGQSGDSYEQHADAVAERVVRGKSAADLLDGHGAALEVHHGPARKKAACSECGGAPAGTGDCPACKATQLLQAIPPPTATVVQRQPCDPSVASCPFEDPGASSPEPSASQPPAAASQEPDPSAPNMSGGPNASTMPPDPANSSTPRWPNQTCTNEILDALQTAMHAACDIGQSTCNPSKVSQKRLDRLNCDEVAQRLARNRACLEARRLIQTTCFGGVPDERHIGPLDAAERSVQHCETLLQRCRQREQEQEQPHTVPTLERVLDVLAILGLSLALAAAIVAALADPEPASKVALAVGSAALALLILERLGIQPEKGFEGA